MLDVLCKHNLKVEVRRTKSALLKSTQAPKSEITTVRLYRFILCVGILPLVVKNPSAA